MASISGVMAAKNEFELSGSGAQAYITPGEAVAASFLAKGSNSSAPYFTVTYNIWGWSEDTSGTSYDASSGDPGVDWTLLAEGSGSAINSSKWVKTVINFEAPSADVNGDTVNEWNVISFRVSASLRRSGYFSNSYTTNCYLDDFKLTSNRPQVHASDQGILIYNSALNYINMTAGGLDMVGGDVNANYVQAPTIKSSGFQVEDGGSITGELQGSDVFIRTQEVGISGSASSNVAGDIILQPGAGAGDGDTAGSIYLTPASGSGTGGAVGTGTGIVVLGPSPTPRMIISGSVASNVGSYDSEIQLKDNIGDKGVVFFTKQSGGLTGTDEGLLKVVNPENNGRLAIGAGSWTSSNNIVISETGRVIIQPTGAPNDVADSSYELNVVGDINYSGAISNVSDRRLKCNIEDITGSLAVINNLEPVRYNKIGYRTIVPDGNPRVAGLNTTQTTMSEDNTVITSSRRELGLIAQDVESYIPEIVMSGSADGHYSVDYLMLTAHLVGSIKELKAEVDSLKNVSHSHS